MATKSNKSSGSQHNSRGVTQGSTLVGPRSGLPFDEIVDSNGKRRLAVDANFIAQNVQATVDLDVAEDGVHIGDPDTGFTLNIEADGSLNANVEVDAADGDNIAIRDSNGDELDIQPDGSINVNVSPTTTPNIANVVTLLANTEYQHSFPANTKKFIVQCRGSAKLKLAFVVGNTNTNYITLFPGNSYKEEALNVSGLSVYFQSSKAGETVEILSWS